MFKTMYRRVGLWDTKNTFLGGIRHRCSRRKLQLESLEARRVLATFYVGPTPDSLESGSLRDAIIQANSTPEADRIVLRPGVYNLSLAGDGEDLGATGDLDVRGNLTIQGAGNTKTIIDASALHDRALDVFDAELVLQGVTIRGGSAAQGGGIRVVDGDLSLSRCQLMENTAEGIDGGNGQGGGIYLERGRIEISKCTFSDNQAIGADGIESIGGFGLGGAVYLTEGLGSVTKSVFSDNRAIGGASAMSSSGSGGNGAGGAVRLDSALMEISKSTFEGNEAIGGSGAEGGLGSSGVTGGSAQGGAISGQSGSRVNLDQCTLRENTAQGGTGGDGSDVHPFGRFGGMGGQAAGGAVAVEFLSGVKMANCTAWGNEAIGGPGGRSYRWIPADSAQQQGGAAEGGAVFAYITSSIQIDRSSLHDNRAVGGQGGDGFRGGAGGTATGGAVFSASDTAGDNPVAISHSVLKDNETVGGIAGQGDEPAYDGHGGATAGGAMALGSFAVAEITRSTLTSNRALGVGGASGGAVDMLGATLDIVDALFADNEAVGGTGSYGTGGAISADFLSKLAIDDSRFMQNKARGGQGIDVYVGGAGQGGALYLDHDTVTTIHSTRFQSNQAIGGAAGEFSVGGIAQGGAIRNVSSLLTITNSDFEKNLALGGTASAAGSQGEATGGAIHCDPAFALVMKSSKVRKNQAIGAIGRGGGVYLTGAGSAHISDSTITKNIASTEGDDIFGPYEE